MSKKVVSGILRFVSMFFFNISKGDEQKNCAWNLKIRKYAFLIFEKGDEPQKCARNFQIRKYAF